MRAFCNTCSDFHMEKTARKGNKTSYISIPKISIYLFTYIYSIGFISTQFTDFAFLKIQIQITFAKLFNVLSNTI